MRLRSSQFVFLLLITCSVQPREEYALRWVEQAVFGVAAHAVTSREAYVQAGQPYTGGAPPTLRHASFDLLPAALAARRIPLAMPRPAAESAAVAVHTGLLRV